MEKRILQFGIMAKVVMIVLLLGVAEMMKGYAQNFAVGDLNYSVNEDGISVTVKGHVNGTSALGEVSIPETIIYDGVSYFVTGIRNQAFMGCSGLSGSLVIPNSITKIGEYAFKNCTGFNGTLTIGTAVTHIEEEAFANTGFISVNFNPTNCTKMGYYREDGDWYGSPVFKDCPTITTLNIGENVTKIPTGAFKNCSGLTGDLNITSLVTSIGYEAFYGCNGFNGILTIPSSVTYIGEMAFNNCSGFYEIHYNAINCGGREEGETVFYGCSALLIIGDDVLKIPDYLFCSGSFTGNLVIPESVTRIGEGAFSGCYHFIGSLTIPNSVVSIGNWAFSGCSHFSGILTIGNSVSNMGYLAFANCGFSEIHYNATSCTGLTPIYNYLGHRPPFEGCSAELTIGENVITIPSNMFRDQYNGVITGNLTIPNSVKTIGDYAFAGNKSLTGNLSLSDSLVSIGDYAFYECYYLNENISIPNSVISVGENAFQGTGWYAQQPDGILYLDNWCLGYKGEKPTGGLEFQEDTKGIANGAFKSCTNLTGDLTIPNTVNRLPKYAFYGCTGFNGVLTIPSTVVSIGEKVFYNCNHFTTVYYNAINCTFGSQYNTSTNYPFENCSGNLVIGDNVQVIPGYIFEKSSFTGTLTMPNSVTEIGYSAFYYCTGLSAVYYSGDIAQWCSIDFLGYGSNPLLYAHNLFVNNELITDLVIPESVTSINNYAFIGGIGFTSLTIPNSVTHIGNFAFCDCSGIIGDLVIPDSVISIGSGAFSGCNGFTDDLVIPNSVTTIGESAFSGCNGLLSITFGDSLSTIDNYAFNGCNGLTSMTLLTATPPTIQMRTFYNCPTSIPIYVPCGSVEAYQSATYWNEFTNIQDNCTQSQTITLNTGWNWFSTYLDIDLAQFEEALGNNGSNITSQNDGFVSYINGIGWTGELNAITPAKMYKVQSASEVSVTISGMLVNPANYTITLNPGDNWIGYPLPESMNLNEAFAGANPMNGDKVSSYGEYAQYYNGVWYGELQVLEPGKGYIYKSNANEVKTFVFASDRQK